MLTVPAVVIVGMILAACNQSIELTLWQWVVAIVTVGSCAGMAESNISLQGKKTAYQHRLKSLLDKYNNDRTLVDLIMEGAIGQGMTSEMVIDALGVPAEVNKRVLSTRTEQTFKYAQTGVNRFAVRVLLQNECVVGWEINGVRTSNTV